MTKTALWCAVLLWPAAFISAQDAAPPATPQTPAPASEPEVSPEEARANRSKALGTFYASRQKNTPQDGPIDLKSFEKGLSDVLKAKDRGYALGAQFGSQIVHDDLEVNLADLVAAFRAVMEGKEPLATQQQVNTEIQKLQARFRQRQEELNKKQQELNAREAAINEAEGNAFLEKNRAAEGVQVTESGLQYKVLEPAKNADAPRPTAQDSVVCHYRGTLLDGTEFDKSRENEPSTLDLRGVIKGWTEGIPLMQVGSKYRFWIPAALAYGSSPRPGGAIKPGHALVFDIELVGIQPPTASKAPATGRTARPEPGEKAVATTPPIAVEIKDGKPIVRQVTPEEEAEAIRKSREAEKEAGKESDSK